MCTLVNSEYLQRYITEASEYITKTYEPWSMPILDTNAISDR